MNHHMMKEAIKRRRGKGVDSHLMMDHEDADKEMGMHNKKIDDALLPNDKSSSHDPMPKQDADGDFDGDESDQDHEMAKHLVGKMGDHEMDDLKNSKPRGLHERLMQKAMHHLKKG